MPLIVVPVDKVRIFRLTESTYHNWVPNTLSSYITLKYTHLKEFNCGSSERGFRGVICNVFDRLGLSRFITAVGPELSKCVLSLKGATAENANLIQNHLVQLESLGVDIFGCKSLFDPEKTRQGPQDFYMW